MKRLFCLSAVLCAVSAGAMPIKSQLMKPKAYFQEVEGGLLEPLDLKAKSLRFTKADFERCGLNLLRQAATMNYSCTLLIPTTARVSKLQNIVTPKMMEVDFGSTKRKVFVSVSEDARQITFMTGFDKTGIDFEVSKFNDDFLPVFDKVAQLVIAEALSKQPVRIEVLESRDSKKPPVSRKQMVRAVVKAGF